MVGSKLYFDNRRPDKEGRGALRIVITKRGTTSMFSTGIRILADQWDGQKVVKHPDMKALNSAIKIKVGNVERALIDLTNEGRLTGKTAPEIVAILQEELDPGVAKAREEARIRKNSRVNGVAAYFLRHIGTKANDGTRQLYEDTYNKLKAFCEDAQTDFDTLSFEQITVSFLGAFEQFCLKTQKQNTASRHLRDVRAVFNSAIDDGVTTNYPFRKYKIKTEETRDKSFSSEELRRLFDYRCYAGGQQEAVDMFKLMFCLIGINPVDLAYLGKEKKGRVEYIRRKTHKLYSVKVEPEARKIMSMYKGKEHLLDIIERIPNYKTYFNRVGKVLRKVGMERVSGKRNQGEAILEDVCIGSARTSWATIAQDELDIDREVIAAALGHHTVDVTSTYLRTQWRRKVDEANRKVLNWVFYGKK